MSKEPIIEGEFRVVGEPPVREPIIKSWTNLWVFVLIIAIAFSVQYWRLMSDIREQERYAASDASGHPAAKEAATSGPVQHTLQ